MITDLKSILFSSGLKIKVKLKFLFGYFTSSRGKYPKTEHRQSRLLTCILRFATLFCVVMLLIIFFFNPHQDLLLNQYLIHIIGLIIFLIIAQILNHVGYYLISTILVVACAFFSPWASLLIDPTILQGDFVPLAYVTFSILLSSILLPLLITITLAMLQFTGLLLVFLLSPATSSFNWFSFLAFVVLTSVFSILANSIIQGNMKQIESQAHQLALNEVHLQELSIRDHLTNLFNRRYLEETLEREIQRAVRTKHSLGVIMLDVDHFKSINDSLGHAAGDIVLQELGKFIAGQIRQSDIACRYGGDEFVLVLPDTSRDVTKDRAGNLRDKVQHLSIQYKNPISITISLGVGVFPDDGSTVEAILKSADIALYRAKHGGGNLMVMAS